MHQMLWLVCCDAEKPFQIKEKTEIMGILVVTSLRPVLQERHPSPVRQLLFNTEDLSCSNLFGTVGGDQATVYDDMHMGDFIAVTLNFVNKRTPHVAGGVSLLHIGPPHTPIASICLRQ